MSAKREPPIIVIDRHGQATEPGGWRHWVAVAASYLVLALVVLVGLVALAGLAATFVMVLAVAVPLAIVVGLIGYATGRVKFKVVRD